MSNEFNSADLLLKYKELLDKGIISDEEFLAKKKQILSSNEITSVQTNNGSSMSPKATGVIAYLTWIGFLIAFLLGDKDKAMFHINQALVINLFALLSIIPVIGWIWAVFMCIIWVMGIVYAYNEEETEVLLIGGIHLLK